MIEIYAFLAAFAVQILAVSVLYPSWLIRYARVRVTSIDTERLAQMYPDVDPIRALERFLTPYRRVNVVITVLGVLLLGWLFNLGRRPDWDRGHVELLIMAYYMVQMLPLVLLGVFGAIYNKVIRGSLAEVKRKAILRRRGLFDFVSPFVVFLAVLVYILFVVFVLYIRQHPFPGFAGLINIGAVTLVYALNAFVTYKQLYGSKAPFDTHEGRVHTIGATVRIAVYSCIAAVVFLSLLFTLALLELKKWEPFALSVFFVINTLLCLTGLIAPPRKPAADGSASAARLGSEAQDLSA
ncbi:MAG TPA: hypothetical protein VKB34_06685 [Povalibacter sp.]|nr:hypothetical protein [Povalibacter sp.]